MKKLLVAISIVALGGSVLTAVVSAATPWSLFGGASSVKQGESPNPWAYVLVSDTNVLADGNDYSGVDFDPPSGPFPLVDLTHLSADYNVTNDDCFGGSPRFQINVDMDGDGDFDGNIFVYIGPGPSFTGCAAGWQSTGNLAGTTDLRIDSTQLGGPFYGDWDDALAAAGPDAEVLGVQLVVDSGWGFADKEQTILVDNVMVNNHRLIARSAR